MNTRIRPQSQSPGAASAKAHGPEQRGVSSALTPGSPLHNIWQPALAGRPRGSVGGRRPRMATPEPKAHAAVGAAEAEAWRVIVSGSRRMCLKGVWGGARRPKTLLCPRTRLWFGEPESQGVWEEGEATRCWLGGRHVDLSGPRSVLKITCPHLQLAPPGTSSCAAHLACSPCCTPLAWPEQARRLVTPSSQAAPSRHGEQLLGGMSCLVFLSLKRGSRFQLPLEACSCSSYQRGFESPATGGEHSHVSARRATGPRRGPEFWDLGHDRLSHMLEGARPTCISAVSLHPSGWLPAERHAAVSHPATPSACPGGPATLPASLTLQWGLVAEAGQVGGRAVCPAQHAPAWFPSRAWNRERL